MRLTKCVAVLVGVALAGVWAGSDAPAKQKDKAPKGWKEYQPEAKDFSLLVPGEPDVESQDPTVKDETARHYSWVKGDARLSLIVKTDRKGEARKDDAKALKLFAADSDIIKGTLKDVKSDGLVGIEYNRKESDGTTAAYRVYRAADGSKAVTLMILKADKLTAEERNAFLSSFKFAKAKK